ncbi:MAG: hypothetical protein V4718_09740 [Pseudomonadota bacterium]
MSLWAGMAIAGTGSAFFSVKIRLNDPGVNPDVIQPAPVTGGSTAAASDVCISKTLSEQTNSLVQIVCKTGQFVSITPLPGKPFLGTHGGAFRYSFSGNKLSGGSIYGAGAPNIGAGTVTALRIYNANGSDGPLEMLVSF